MIANLRGVSLHKITVEDIEMLRLWRNDKKVAANMFYQKHISPQMQLQWFNSLTNNDYYFIIKVKGEAVGLINLCNINHTKQDAQAGLFIYNENFWGTPAPVLASLMLLHFAFEEKKLEKVWAKVRPENKAALQYNKMLGFEKAKDNLQQLTRTNYQKTTALLIQKIIH